MLYLDTAEALGQISANTELRAQSTTIGTPTGAGLVSGKFFLPARGVFPRRAPMPPLSPNHHPVAPSERQPPICSKPAAKGSNCFLSCFAIPVFFPLTLAAPQEPPDRTAGPRHRQPPTDTDTQASLIQKMNPESWIAKVRRKLEFNFQLDANLRWLARRRQLETPWPPASPSRVGEFTAALSLFTVRGAAILFSFAIGLKRPRETERKALNWLSAIDRAPALTAGKLKDVRGGIFAPSLREDFGLRLN